MVTRPRVCSALSICARDSFTIIEMTINIHVETLVCFPPKSVIWKLMIFTLRPLITKYMFSLQRRHNGRDSVSNHQPHV